MCFSATLKRFKYHRCHLVNNYVKYRENHIASKRFNSISVFYRLINDNLRWILLDFSSELMKTILNGYPNIILIYNWIGLVNVEKIISSFLFEMFASLFFSNSLYFSGLVWITHCFLYYFHFKAANGEQAEKPH